MVADMDAVPVGDLDVDADDHQLYPLQINFGLMETACMGAKNAHTLLTDTRRMQPLQT